jgi:hypothetical protein
VAVGVVRRARGGMHMGRGTQAEYGNEVVGGGMKKVV